MPCAICYFHTDILDMKLNVWANEQMMIEGEKERAKEKEKIEKEVNKRAKAKAIQYGYNQL